METHNSDTQHNIHKRHYRKLLLMALLSFISMYILMYAMVDTFANVYANTNEFYMAALMAAPMVIIEVILMSSMYRDRKLNMQIIVLSILVLVLCFFFIRKQSAIGDKQFLKSMIPHHAGAILMVRETDLSDPKIQKLAQDIITSQENEIAFMKAKLKQMEEE